MNRAAYAKSHPLEMEKINVACEFGCKGACPYFTNLKQCEKISPDQSALRGACEARVGPCTSCISRYDFVNLQPVWGTDCTACFVAQQREGLSQIFKYDGVPACQFWDTRVVRTKLAKRGRERDAITLELESDQVLATLRSGASNLTDDPEGRKVPFLTKSTIQEN